ncbi:MAG: DNA polymerase/3'-5' exonuclease PolX [Bradymonadaceae bacterium]|nr:DNA polymerase/3'-5' exonuclease PolX [Lujinxingiaceae bacterium]
MDNQSVARILSEIAQLMEIKGENRFKVRAFENAARSVESLSEDLEALAARGELNSLAGVGKSLAADIEALLTTGSCDVHRDLLDELDPGLLDMLRIQGLGPKRIKVIYETLGVSNLSTLEAAARAQQIRALAGLGAKTEERILAEIERLSHDEGRTPLPAARAIAQSIRDKLATLSEVTKIAIAGSLRRGRETIGDIDILVASETPAPISAYLVELAEVAEVLAHGETKTSVRLVSGIQVDLRIVAPSSFGAALHYFTGSKEHHIALRTRAKRSGLKINEYGVFKENDGPAIASETEVDVFKALGLTYIPPELREGRGEIEAAAAGTLPGLVELTDIRGDVHMHTVETDGRATILEMADAARTLGYNFIVITDHSEAVRVANGMTPPRFREHIKRIREADAAYADLRLLAGIEVDILKDGSLDMEHELLADCDWVVGSIHSHFALDSKEMTQRLITAMATGLISCLGHPTGRILGGRPGYKYDLDAVLEAAVEFGVAVEINGSTGRLDFNAEHAERAHRRGAKIVLGSDAHSTRGLEDMDFAVQQARRAWLGASDVLNTLSVEDLLAAVRPTLRR